MEISEWLDDADAALPARCSKLAANWATPLPLRLGVLSEYPAIEGGMSGLARLSKSALF